MSDALPSFVAPEQPTTSEADPKHDTAKDKLAKLTAKDFDSSESSLWVPSVLDVSNFAICVKYGNPEATTKVGYGYGDEMEEEVAADAAYEAFRSDLKQLKKGTTVAVSFDRKTAGQLGGGHWTPIGAYSSETDMVCRIALL